MNWINSVVRPKIRSILRKKDMPDNLWVKCPETGQMIYYKDLEANQFVVPGSNYHMRMAAAARLKALFDNGEYETVPLPEVPVDPLKFRDERRYTDRLKDARHKTGLADALLADAEWTVLPVDGVRVGVVGLVTEKTPAMTVRRGNEGVRFEAARAALQRLVPEVREKCDLLVALTHVGFEEDVELVGAHGNLAMHGNDRVLHLHCSLSGPELISLSGHLFEAKVAVTVEFLVRDFGLRIDRAAVPEVGLNLIQPEGGARKGGGPAERKKREHQP